MEKRQQIPADQWLENGLVKHNLPAPQHLIKCATVLDIGAGIRPMQWYKPVTHECVEPHRPYAEKLIECGYTTYISEAAPFLLGMIQRKSVVEAIYMLDMIEHVEKAAGEHIIELAKLSATRQIVIYTPQGFLHQEGDGFGMGGEYWQKHRSGWTLQDFPGWIIESYGRGFFAILNL